MIEVVRESPAPTDRLWSVMSQVRRWPRWLPTVDAVTPLDPARPDEVGASYTVEQPGLPRAVWTITEIRPGRSFTWESARPGIRSVGTHELRPGPDGTTTIVLGIAWSGLLAPLLRLAVGRKARDYVTREAEALDLTAGADAGSSGSAGNRPDADAGA
ncbi:MAG TPA: SRPBCC family protein [Ornithinibacter sp.]|nr:SRPBCC family protein [Ornithinibacter sp.]